MTASDASAAAGPPAPIAWTLAGTSGIYLAHFASLYTQLPGLYGSVGLQPVTELSAAVDQTWLLHLLPPQPGMEGFAVAGMLLSMAQLTCGWLRYGVGGMAAFSVQCLLWHDLVYAGGRFTAYQARRRPCRRYYSECADLVGRHG